MTSSTVPIIRYQDAKGAIAWLCEVVGFEVFLEVAGDADCIEHARLILGGNMVMLASLGRSADIGSKFVSPAVLGGVNQAISILVDNPESIYQRVSASSANIIQEIEKFEFGGMTFSFEDPESHLWVVTSHNPWIKSW